MASVSWWPNVEQLTRQRHRRSGVVVPSGTCFELLIGLSDQVKSEESWHVKLEATLHKKIEKDNK